MEDLRQFDGKSDFYSKIFGPGQTPGKRADSLAVADFIRVPSIEACIERIENLGGQVVIPKKAVPGAGYFAVCLDTENRAFGLWEDKEGVHS